MIYLYIVLAVLAALLVFVLLAPIEVHIAYKDKKVIFELTVGGIKLNLNKFINKGTQGKKVKKKRKPKQEHADDREKKLLDKINDTYDKVVYIKNVYNASTKSISKRFIIKNLEADICFGTSDAAVTGILTGAVWALLYEFLGLLTIISTVKKHRFNVDSVYDKFVFDANVDVTFNIRTISGFVILIKVLYNLKKYNKHNKKHK